MIQAASGERVEVSAARGVLPFAQMATSGDWTVTPGQHGGVISVNTDGKEQLPDGRLIYPAG